MDFLDFLSWFYFFLSLVVVFGVYLFFKCRKDSFKRLEYLINSEPE
ncbi:MAG: hypothetical protein ABH803_02855 [Candidatus Micrarchaeota archaeon]